MGLADTGKSIGPTPPTDAGCADVLKVHLFRQVRRAGRALEAIQGVFNAAPGGAQGCVDEFTAGEYTEFTNMIDDLEAFHNDHKLSTVSDITVTVPAQTP